MGFDVVFSEIGEFGSFQKYLIFISSAASVYTGLIFLNSFFVLAIPEHRHVAMGFDVVFSEIGSFQKYRIFVSSAASVYTGLIFLNSFFVLAIPEHRHVAMGFDVVFSEIGSFQKYRIFVSSAASVYTGLIFLNSFFVLAIPEHRCAIPGLDNDTYAVQGPYHEYLINLTIPPPSEPGKAYEECHLFRETPGGSRVEEKCERWVYDKSVFESTLSADLNIVCDRTILKSSAQMLFFGGLLSGSFITGLFSDRFGRKRTLCVSTIFYFAAALGITWVSSYSAYVILLFSVGFFSVGNFMPAFVMGMEFVGPSSRRIAGNIGGFYWIAGNVILSGLGYLIRDWRTLQLACAVPGALFNLFWFDKILPESPRWLYSKGRRAECEKVIDRAAEWGKVKLPNGFYDKVFVAEEKIPQGKLWHLFMSKTLCIRTLIIYFNWLVVCLAYYGLALNSGDIGGDMYLNFFLQSFMDVPGSVFIILYLDKFGRRPLMVGTMLMGGIGCLATVFTIMYGGEDLKVLTTVFAMVGKVGAAAGFSMAYVYSAELYPTVVRNAGMGSSSCMARVGGMMAPYIADLDRLIGGNIGKAMPQIVFGSLSVVAALMALHLPETNNRSMMETIEDAENFTKKDANKSDKEAYINEAFEENGIVSRL